MISFGALDVTFRPLGKWPGEATPAGERGSSRFRASWQATLKLLRTEITALEPERTIVQMDLTEHAIRRDGLPRADARPSSPGVVLSLELEPGVWAHFPCDSYLDWEDNVRAIALTLHALRAIDRYGVTKRGEQYAGWKQIPAQTGGGGLSLDEAAETLAKYAGIRGNGAALRASAEVRQIAYRKAAARTHPDAGGSVEAFQLVGEAKRLLDMQGDAAA